MTTDDMPMCDECGAILDDDGFCPEWSLHGTNDPLALFLERRKP